MVRAGGGTGPAARIGVYLCRCGTNIADTVDVPALVAFAAALPGVVAAREDPFLCAEAGQARIREDVATLGLNRVVVGACSPHLHEETFRRACAAAGLDASALQVANLREQVAWVTGDAAAATAKARALVAAAVARVARHEAIPVERLPVTPTVLVVGGGIAGIEAALRLADAGRRVVLVERERWIGGHVALLDKTFPTLDCSACVLLPKLSSVVRHPGIQLLAGSEVEGVSGRAGRFVVRVRSRARHVDADACTRCGACLGLCPEGSVGGIRFPPPHAVPGVPFLDAARCARSRGAACAACADACPTGAIDLSREDEVREVEAGGVVLATGFVPFDPARAPQYGYGRWDDILTSLELERLCHPASRTGGRILKKDGRVPASVAVLHCVGSRDVRYNPWCSRICCMTALKLAREVRRRTGARVFSFFVDLRASGKGGEEFYEEAQRSGVVFVHGKGTEVIGRGGKLLVKAEDTVLGRRVIVPVDMVVLAVGLEPRPDAARVARLFGVGRSANGFFQERHLKFAPVETVTPGVVAAGGCLGPRDIPDSVSQGAAAAASLLALLARGTLEALPTVAAVDSARCSGCLLCIPDCSLEAIRPAVSFGRPVVEVDSARCQGCGTCAVTCPAGAIAPLGFTDPQLLAEIEGLLSAG